MEHSGCFAESGSLSSVLAHLVVSQCRRTLARWSGPARPPPPRHKAKARPGSAGAILATTDPVTGGRAQAHRRRTSRWFRTEPAGNQESRAVRIGQAEHPACRAVATGRDLYYSLRGYGGGPNNRNTIAALVRCQPQP